MGISELLQINKGITSIIGGGGKTSLMLKLAQELAEKGNVIICTSTKIFPPENIEVITSAQGQEIVDAVNKHGIICVSEGTDENGKLMPPAIDINTLAEVADYVICEADGAKRLPLKAHADYEPVIPEKSSQTILVVGADGIGKTIMATCHRPEIYARIAGVKLEDTVTAEIVARVIEEEQLGTKLFINKVESEELWQEAKKISELVKLPTILGSLRNGEYKCL